MMDDQDNVEEELDELTQAHLIIHKNKEFREKNFLAELAILQEKYNIRLEISPATIHAIAND